MHRDSPQFLLEDTMGIMKILVIMLISGLRQKTVR